MDLFQILDEGLLMDFPGQMNGAFTVNRIPARRIRRAEKLGFQPNARDGFISGQILHPRRSLPGCSAGRAPDDLEADNPSLFQFNVELGFAKLLCVWTQTDPAG